jgi:hypothetical protein
MSDQSSAGYSTHTVRRIITSHSPSDTDGSSVSIHDDALPLNSGLGGNAHFSPLFASIGIPATSSHSLTSSDITDAMALAPSVVTPNGVNAQVTDLAPNFKVGMHRTNSIGEQRTLVNAGEIVVQRGTLHAWEAGPEGARWCTVVVAALPVEKDGKELAEVDF